MTWTVLILTKGFVIVVVYFKVCNNITVCLHDSLDVWIVRREISFFPSHSFIYLLIFTEAHTAYTPPRCAHLSDDTRMKFNHLTAQMWRVLSLLEDHSSITWCGIVTHRRGYFIHQQNYVLCCLSRGLHDMTRGGAMIVTDCVSPQVLRVGSPSSTSWSK